MFSVSDVRSRRDLVCQSLLSVLPPPSPPLLLFVAVLPQFPATITRVYTRVPCTWLLVPVLALGPGPASWLLLSVLGQCASVLKDFRHTRHRRTPHRVQHAQAHACTHVTCRPGYVSCVPHACSSCGFLLCLSFVFFFSCFSCLGFFPCPRSREPSGTRVYTCHTPSSHRTLQTASQTASLTLCSVVLCVRYAFDSQEKGKKGRNCTSDAEGTVPGRQRGR